MNDKGVCRQAPATPGLLNIMKRFRWLPDFIRGKEGERYQNMKVERW